MGAAYFNTVRSRCRRLFVCLMLSVCICKGRGSCCRCLLTLQWDGGLATTSARIHVCVWPKAKHLTACQSGCCF